MMSLCNFLICAFLPFLCFAEAQMPFQVDESRSRNPLVKIDVPFVPEEFRSSQKRIIFDKNDFVNLQDSSDIQDAIRDSILTLLNKTQTNETKVSNGL